MSTTQTGRQTHTDEPGGKQRHSRQADAQPELPGLDRARVAVAHMVSNKAGKEEGVSGGALRCLLAFTAAADASGRFTTTHGENILFWSQQYYKHIASLQDAGMIRRLGRQQHGQRYLEVTASGSRVAAKVGRLIEAAAREFIERSTG